MRKKYLSKSYIAEHSKRCPNCKKDIFKINKICPFCHSYQKNYIPSLKIKRNLKIVELLNTGNYTLQEVANIFKISSRERARQIYVKITNLPYADKYRKKEKIIRDIKKINKLREVKFHCRGCGKPVTFGEIRGGGKAIYCNDCHYISAIERRIPYIWWKCEECEKKFHPYRNWKQHNSQRRFHSMECYKKYKKKHKGLFGRTKRRKIN